MRQAATAEVCVGVGKTARFSVPLPSTASFDRLLPMPRRFAVAQVGQKRDPAPKSPAIGECRLMRVRSRLHIAIGIIEV